MIERRAWDRLERESPKAYEAFRAYRDQGTARTLVGLPGHHRQWSVKWNWSARATAWDDELHMLDDRRRLEAIRTMHDQHTRAARAALAKGLAALQALSSEEIGAAGAARLIEVGTRLERQMLTTSVEELQGLGRSGAVEDPWEVIARELAGTGTE